MAEQSEETETPNPSLPLILVSAYDLASANALISEITNNSNNNTKDASKESRGCVWQIVNKYYEVEVELYPVADSDTLPPSLAERLEAHIIYITDDEEGESGAERAEQRWARAVAAGAGAGESVRLAVTAGARAAPALAAWARRRRYEPVPLREAPAADDDADFPDTYGAERARAALHAHAWRGLRRLDAPARTFLPLDPTGATSSDEEWGGEGEAEWDGEGSEGEEGEVERAEAFAEALGALGAAREDAARLPTAERRRRAERLVQAFCHALGTDLHAL